MNNHVPTQIYRAPTNAVCEAPGPETENAGLVKSKDEVQRIGKEINKKFCGIKKKKGSAKIKDEVPRKKFRGNRK